MRFLLSIWILCIGLGLNAQHTQSDTLYLPPNTINEVVIGTIVEGDSVLVALSTNNATESSLRFRRIGHDGGIGMEVDFMVPFFSIGPIAGKAFMKSPDGGYFVGVYTAGDIQYFTGVVLKFTSDFQLEWQRNADHFESDYNYAAWNVIHTTMDNNLLAVGDYAWHPNPGPDDGTLWGLALTKYTPEGDTLWSKVMDIGELVYPISKIYELPNGELILTGIWDNVIISKSVIYKIGPNGEYWDKIVQGPNNLFGTTPVGFYHNGKFYAFFGAHQNQFGGLPVEMTLYMAILDVETMTWDDQIVIDTDIAEGESLGAGFTEAINLGNGHAILTAIKFIDTIEEQDPVYLLDIDTTGTINWIRHIPVPSVPGSFLHNLPNFLDTSSDGGYTINGYFSNTIVSQAHWYVKTDPCGQVLPYTCDPNGVEEMFASNGVAVYPNPANNKLFITAEEEMRSIALYNRYGQLIVNQGYNKRSLQAEIDVSMLASGFYLARVELESGVTVTRKIIVE
jgi:Secretion system C-terminal sorting domain